MPPYTLIAKPNIKSIADLKHRPVSFGTLADIVRIYGERMLASAGIKPDEVDLIIAGSNASRFAALQSGIADAAIVTVPITFRAEHAGFTNLGEIKDYVNDMPFTVFTTSRPWAQGHAALVKNFAGAYFKAVEWWYDPSHRSEAVKILADAAKMDPTDAEQSYDYFQKIEFFDRSDTVSIDGLAKAIAVLKQLAQLDHDVDPKSLLMPQE